MSGLTAQRLSSLFKRSGHPSILLRDLDQDPGPMRFLRRPVLLGRPEGWGTAPVRRRRISPPWPSSWNLSTTCCPWCCPRAKSPPQALWGLCRLGDSTSSLGHPTPQRIGISPASPAAGSVWRPGHHREPAHAQDWPGSLWETSPRQGLVYPDRPKREGVTHLSQGRGCSTASSSEQWASFPVQAQQEA